MKYRKPLRYRGGYRIVTPRGYRAYVNAAGYAVGAGSRLYSAVKKKYPDQVSKLEQGVKTKLGEGVSLLSKGIKDKIVGGTPGGSLAPISLMKGIVSSSGTGDVTETQFTANTIGKVSKQVQQVLSSAVNLQLKCSVNGKLVSDNAFQGVTSLGLSNPSSTPPTSKYSCNMILGGNSVLGSNTPSEWGSLYSLYRSSPLSTTGQSASSTYSTGYFYLDRAVGELSISNVGTSSAVIDIYEIIAKEDSVGTLDIDPYTAWKDGLINYNVGDEVSSFYALAKITPTTIGCRPQSSQYFNAFWEVCCHNRVTLAKDAVHIHRSTYVYEDLVPVIRMFKSAVLRGITRNLFIVLRGAPGTTGTNNQVDAAGSIVWTHNITYSGKYIQPSTKVTTEVFSDSYA